MSANEKRLRAIIEALRAVIDSTAQHWLSLTPGIEWKGGIDEAMRAAVGEIRRLRAREAKWTELFGRLVEEVER